MLLLEETATVTDLSMHDPLGFDSDESAIFGNISPHPPETGGIINHFLGPQDHLG
jgi:hypothetical protein